MKKFVLAMSALAMFALKLVAGAPAARAEGPAHVVVLVKIKDQEKLDQYLALAQPILKSFGGKIIARGKVGAFPEGHADVDMVAVGEFPTPEAIDAFYASKPYVDIIELRKEAADITVMKLSVPAF